MRWIGLMILMLALSCVIAARVQSRVDAELSRRNFVHCGRTCDDSPRVATCIVTCWSLYVDGVDK
jgi:hypothetical protein